ncbi:hypothetical protein ISCGN_016777 [Ixodes scapularis]
MPPVCGICLEGLRCQALVAPACGHVFHQQCLRTWGEDSLCCPLCRTTVHPGDLRRIFLSEKPRIRARKNTAMPPVCGICLEGLRCQALVAPACGHVFHQQCLRIWGEDSLCCPLCRTTVHPGDLRRIFLSEKPRIRARKNTDLCQASPDLHYVGEEDTATHDGAAPTAYQPGTSSSVSSDSFPDPEPATLMDRVMVLMSEVNSLGRDAAYKLKLKVFGLEEELRRGVGDAVRLGSCL